MKRRDLLVQLLAGCAVMSASGCSLVWPSWRYRYRLTAEVERNGDAVPGDSTISASAALLPQLRGFGEVKDLRVAMTGDAALQGMVASFVANPSNDNDAWRELTFCLIARRMAG